MKYKNNNVWHNERGSIALLIALFMIGMVGVLWLLVIVTSDLRDASRAQTAADAAALAGAMNGPIAARTAAVANGGSVVNIKDNAQLGAPITTATGGGQQSVGDMTVTVKIGRHTARARAQSKQGGSALAAIP